MPKETYTKEQLDNMSPQSLNNLLMRATKIEGVAVVRDKDGNPKYDDRSKAGTYHEDRL